MACRVCLELGIDDPERWLHETPKRVVDLWQAYWRLEPWGLPWHRHATWMQMLDRIYGAIVTWFGGKHESTDFADFMPADWIKPKQKKKRGSLRQDLAILKAMYGGRK